MQQALVGPTLMERVENTNGKYKYSSGQKSPARTRKRKRRNKKRSV